MKIKKYGYAVWDKMGQKFLTFNNHLIFNNKHIAWLAAGKERKSSGCKVVKISLSIK
ncbi:MAG: hypothetical protein V4547_17155 [Bacteroidota bacterium]